MSKLIIQIPCLNEEKTLPSTLADLPRQIEGIDSIEILVVDDGSTDGTTKIALEQGVEHVLSLGKRCGLARAFMAGIETALELNADVIVNTDADNQYVGEDIAKLLKPIMEGQADIVIGARPIAKISHFSTLKKILQRLGSAVLRQVSQTTVEDAPSGFRAYSREAALRLNVFSRFTYTMETLIQAGRQGLRVVSVPIRVNPKTRESRLFKGLWSYVWRSLTTITRIYILYAPLRFFLWLGIPLFSAGMFLMFRWLYLYFFPIVPGRTHVPSLILGSILILMGIQLLALGVIADLISKNRMMTEQLLYRIRKRGWKA